MSSLTNMISSNNNNKDLSEIFYPRTTTDPSLSFNTNMISSNNKDLTELFYPYIYGETVPNTYYKTIDGLGNLQDLSQLFQNITVAPILYTISNIDTGLNITTIDGNGHTGLIFENQLSPTEGSILKTCNITFNTTMPINILVIGGGGGGACGNSGASGAGAAGAGIIYQESHSVNATSIYDISVSNGASGRKVNNGGPGASAGWSGGESSFSNTSLNLSAGGGQEGLGIGTANGYAGGGGGSSSNSLNNTGGGGGGGGGGGSGNGTIIISNPTTGKLNNGYNVGTIGTNGTSVTGFTGDGGDGGKSYYTNQSSGYISLPFTNRVVYSGNGGGGGGSITGGNAGKTIGGVGGGSSGGSGARNGQDAIYGLYTDDNYYYGNGGGGGDIFEGGFGGNGGNGVVMIWWSQ